jgi:hypothetical protein
MCQHADFGEFVAAKAKHFECVQVCSLSLYKCVRARFLSLSPTVRKCTSSTTVLTTPPPPWQVLLRHGARSADSDDEGRSAEAYAPREATQLRTLLSTQTLHLRDTEKLEDFARFRVWGLALGA